MLHTLPYSLVCHGSPWGRLRGIFASLARCGSQEVPDHVVGAERFPTMVWEQRGPRPWCATSIREGFHKPSLLAKDRLKRRFTCHGARMRNYMQPGKVLPANPQGTGPFNVWNSWKCGLPSGQHNGSQDIWSRRPSLWSDSRYAAVGCIQKPERSWEIAVLKIQGISVVRLGPQKWEGESIAHCWENSWNQTISPIIQARKRCLQPSLRTPLNMIGVGTHKPQLDSVVGGLKGKPEWTSGQSSGCERRWRGDWGACEGWRAYT